MQILVRTGLCRCFACGTTNPIFLKNAANKFSVRCSNPDCRRGRTRWLSKEDAIVEWFDLFLYGSAKIQFVRTMINDNQRKRQEKAVAREAKQFTGYDNNSITRQISTKD